jgi:hypothetical protein
VNDTLREILVADIPPAFVTRFLDAAAWAYREAWQRAENDPSLTDAAKDDLIPHLRRALIESKLHEVGLDCGLRVESERVSSGAYRYVAARSGRFVLTCSKTSGRNAVPRGSIFRDQYAEINEHLNQASLFPATSDPGAESLYGIIVHGPDGKGDKIGFCCVGFLSPDKQEWVQEPTDLADIRDYQQQRYQKITDSREQIQSAEPKLKPKFGTNADSAEESA